MTPDDWRFLVQQTGPFGIFFIVFLYGFRRRWWVPGSEVEEKDKRFADSQELAQRFLRIAERAIAQANVQASAIAKRTDE